MNTKINQTVQAKGFTLIELIIAIAIIGILFAFVAPNFRGATSKAIETRRELTVRSIHQAIDLDVSISQDLPTTADRVKTILTQNNVQIPAEEACGFFYIPAGNESLDFVVATAGLSENGGDGGPWIYQTTNKERFDLNDANSNCDGGPNIGGADAIKLN